MMERRIFCCNFLLKRSLGKSKNKIVFQRSPLCGGSHLVIIVSLGRVLRRVRDL